VTKTSKLARNAILVMSLTVMLNGGV